MTTRWRQETEPVQLGSSVIEHPFWARWACGELTREELALFAGEYDQVATAIAGAATRASRLDPRFTALADQERQHLTAWRQFSRALGWGGGRAACVYAGEVLPETEACARLVAGERSAPVEDHLSALSEVDAIEDALGEVMLNGLLRHYGFEAGPATEYFSSAALRVEAPAGRGGAIEIAYWKMLDGFEAAAAEARA
jgi:pyrroloquinoline quinone (PQQ) biosynthesis protein C